MGKQTDHEALSELSRPIFKSEGSTTHAGPFLRVWYFGFCLRFGAETVSVVVSRELRELVLVETVFSTRRLDDKTPKLFEWTSDGL